ncbi:related to FAD1 |uniref:FAD synthase n=1 Tax=Ustilago trichophora TaxID=86804 RepID=A0A5C3EEF3_9BASI|nr:related to FAD1 \
MSSNGDSNTSAPPPPLPPTTKPSREWIASIDAVYTLFEDPTVSSRYPDLSAKVKDAVQLCEQVINQVGQPHCALSFNGGKDCTVLVHILSAVLRRVNGLSSSKFTEQGQERPGSAKKGEEKEELPSIPSLYITCPSPFPTVEKFISYCVSNVHGYNLEVISVEGGMKAGIRTYLDGGGERRVGISPSSSSSSSSSSSTTQTTTPSTTPREIKAIFVGTRRDDPHGPQLSPRSWTDKDWPRVERIHPILNWTYQDVWCFLRCPHLSSTESALGMSRDTLAEKWGTAGGGDQGVPYCLLYDQGYTSLGSTFNTLPNPELKAHDQDESDGGQADKEVGDGTAKGKWKPAYMLQDGSLERAGRVENSSQQQQPKATTQQ